VACPNIRRKVWFCSQFKNQDRFQLNLLSFGPGCLKKLPRTPTLHRRKQHFPKSPLSSRWVCASSLPAPSGVFASLGSLPCSVPGVAAARVSEIFSTARRARSSSAWALVWQLPNDNSCIVTNKATPAPARPHRIRVASRATTCPRWRHCTGWRSFTPCRTCPCYTAQAWLCERDGETAGVIAVRPDCVDHLYLHPAYQGRGIGSTLLAVAQSVEEHLHLWTFSTRKMDAHRISGKPNEGTSPSPFMIRTTENQRQKPNHGWILNPHFPKCSDSNPFVAVPFTAR
jgi:GNAT superfamily N-acetyltransferase